MRIDTNSSLSHTTWNCKYHIVFAPKYRRQVIYGKIKGDIGNVLRNLCEWKGVETADEIYLTINPKAEQQSLANMQQPKRKRLSMFLKTKKSVRNF